MRVLVTGATGFVGSNLAAALVARGDEVRVLRRAHSRLDALEGLDVTHMLGDILDEDSLRCALEGCDQLFHVAGMAQYWRSTKETIYRVNVEGTRRVMDAALKAGVTRVVHTSSIAALGIPSDDTIIDESHDFPESSRWWAYGHSKHLAEKEVGKAVQNGLSAVMVNPAVIMGPRDVNFVSGELIRASLRGLLRMVPPGGSNVVHVDDVVQAHLAAAERGVLGERYILGGENLSHWEMAALLSDVCGGPPPRWKMPSAVLPPLRVLMDVWNRLRGGVPALTGEQVRLSGHRFFVDASKATRDLGLAALPVRQAAQDAFNWYKEHGLL